MKKTKYRDFSKYITSILDGNYTLSQIAIDLGLANSTVHENLNEMKKQKLIRYKQYSIFLNEDKVLEYLSFEIDYYSIIAERMEDYIPLLGKKPSDS